MDPDTIRAIVTALRGSLAAALLRSRTSKWLQQTHQGGAIDHLVCDGGYVTLGSRS